MAELVKVAYAEVKRIELVSFTILCLGCSSCGALLLVVVEVG